MVNSHVLNEVLSLGWLVSPTALGPPARDPNPDLKPAVAVREEHPTAQEFDSMRDGRHDFLDRDKLPPSAGHPLPDNW